MRRLAAAAIALTLCAACGSRVRNWDDQLAMSQPDSQANPAQPTSTVTAGDRPHPASTLSAAPTSRAPVTTRPDAQPGAVPVPKPGAYTYDVATTYPADEDGPAETDASVETLEWAVTASGNEAVSSSTQRYVEDDGFFRSTYRTTAHRFELVSETAGYEDETSTCRYTPALLVLQLPLAAGAAWRATASCDDEGAQRAVVVSSQVIGTARDRVGTTTVDAVVVKSVLTDTTTDPEDPDSEAYTYRLETTTHYDPATLLVLLQDTVETDSDDPAYKITEHRQLRSVAPR